MIVAFSEEEKKERARNRSRILRRKHKSSGRLRIDRVYLNHRATTPERKDRAMAQMYQFTGDNRQLCGAIGSKTELVSRARAAGLVVASAWDDKTIPVYTDRDRARTDMSGERACALIRPVREET